MKKQSGFTLIELLGALAIVGVLVGIGMPSMTEMVKSSRLTATTNELVSALHIARSEAIKLNKRVTVCESTDGTSCTQNNDWNNGWIVFIDGDDALLATAGDLVGTGSACTDATLLTDDCLLRVHGSINDPLLNITGLLDATGLPILSFTFTARGHPKDSNGASTSGIFSLCSMSDVANTFKFRTVILSIAGRVRLSDNVVINACP
jgi:type IV fimbrial biogenesis protein FimT